MRADVPTILAVAFLALALPSMAAGRFAMLKPQAVATAAWGTEIRGPSTSDYAPMLSTLPRGETGIGTLRSPDFECPPMLSFWIAGHSRQNANFVKLVDAADGAVLKTEPVPGTDAAKLIEWDTSDIAGRQVHLLLVDGDTGSGWAWISFGRLQPEVAPMPGSVGEVPAGWTEVITPPRESTADGIPFLEASIWSGGSATLDMGGVRAKQLHILGGTNSVDEPNPGWGGSDSFQNIFIGDSAGSIRISYGGGAADDIPLVFGYTIWWKTPYIRSPEPFRGDPKVRAILDRALCVANGTGRPDKPYHITIALRDEPVESITFTDDPAKVGHAVVRGITFGEVSRPGLLDPDRFARADGGDMPAEMATWLASHTIASSDPYPAERRKVLEELSRIVCVTPADINPKTIASTKPAITASNYPGPSVRFTGGPIADIMTNVYFENSHQLLGRVDEDGMVHESEKGADNYGGFGGYTPGLGAFYTSSYTRLRALTLLSNAGFDEKVGKAIDYFDKWLMYFPQSYPEIQMGGKPVPGHATVIANKPHIYFDELKNCGWPTRFTTRDYGNPETDGHGLLMLTRWRAWIKSGRSKDWVEKRWAALNEAAEWIPWCLDNPDLSLCRNGLLYAESEGGMTAETLYCNVPCWLGLLGYAEMADAAGKPDKAKRWQEQADRLLTAMNAQFPGKSDKWGDIWEPGKAGGWGPATALAPIVIGTDLYGCDAINRLPKDWAERTRRTYAMQIETAKPRYCSPAGMGYNQCYFAEAALLLDEMADAGGFIEWMARLCFSPNLPHPYRVPEGATVATDGSIWRRWGDLGNLYQLAEVVYTTHLMIGIDDLDPAKLLLMPRLPIGWTGMDVGKWPVRTTSGGKSELIPISIRLRRDKQARKLDMEIGSEKPIGAVRLRLGPFPRDAKKLSVRQDERRTTHDLFAAGDSTWAWIEMAGPATVRSIHASVQ